MSATPQGRITFAVPPELIDSIVDLAVVRVRAELAETKVDPWLTVQDAAAYLRCKPKRIYDLSESGRLRTAKDGRRSLFRRSWLDETLEESGP